MPTPDPDNPPIAPLPRKGPPVPTPDPDNLLIAPLPRKDLPVPTPDPGDPLIDEALVRRLLAAQFPRWAELPLSPVSRSGVDNATFRLGTDMSVRLPRYPRWVGQVDREHEWLPRLTPHLPLPISEPLAKGRPGDGYPFPWSVYRWLPGETTEELADPVEAAKELAGFVSALQRIDATGGPGPSWSDAFRGVPMGDERDSVAAEARVRLKIEALRGIGHALQDRPTTRRPKP